MEEVRKATFGASPRDSQGNNRQAQVEVAVAQSGFDALAVHVDQVDLDLRVAALEARQQRRQKIAQYRVRGADTHSAVHGVAEKQRLTERVLQGVENVSRMLRELVAFRSQRHAMGQAVEQADTHGLLQMQHRGRDRRLRNMRLECRLGKLASVGGSHEIAQLAHGNVIAFCHLIF